MSTETIVLLVILGGLFVLVSFFGKDRKGDRGGDGGSHDGNRDTSDSDGDGGGD
jgi:hypothetical protein